MGKGVGNPTPTSVIIHRLRLMADAGGILTRDRVKTVIEAADRIEELNEQISIMADKNDTSLSSDMFP